MLTNDQKMFLYKIQTHQNLSKYTNDVRVALCGPFLQFLQGNPAVLQNIWFTDEAYFHLDDYVNKQNMQICTTENPDKVTEVPLHTKRCIVWCAVSATGVVGPLYFANSDNKRL
jgi:hypothetical protein